MYQAIHYDDHGPMTDPMPLSAATRSGSIAARASPYDGVPVGTGDAGGLLYQTAYGLELTVNHADALDYAPDRGHAGMGMGGRRSARPRRSPADT